MPEFRVTVSRPAISIQPDDFAGQDASLGAAELIESGLAEAQVLRLKRARVTFTLESSGG